METQERVKVYGVYLGQHNSGGHKYLFFENLDSNDGQPIYSKVYEKGNFKKKLGATEVGGVYEFGKTGNSFSFSKKPTLLAWWNNSDEKWEWKTLARAYQDSRIKLNPENEKTLKNLVVPLRQAYLSANYSSRAYILGEVIRLITTGS